MWRGGYRLNISVAAPSFGGALVVQPWLRFHIPLIEPDRRISRIRLSDKTSTCWPLVVFPTPSANTKLCTVLLLNTVLGTYRDRLAALPVSTVALWSEKMGSRVEERRGDLGPLAIVPFPPPAHRTGRADFSHPALQAISHEGMQHTATLPAELEDLAGLEDVFGRELP